MPPRVSASSSVAVTLGGHKTTVSVLPDSTVEHAARAAAEKLAIQLTADDLSATLQASVFGQCVPLAECLSTLRCASIVFTTIGGGGLPSNTRKPKRGRVSELLGRALQGSDDDGDSVVEVKREAGTPAAASNRVSFPIVVGSVVLWKGDRAPEKQTHEWTVYVRGVHNEDVSDLVESVTFTLHQTFEQRHRVIATPPFEVKEKGWGQFTVFMAIRLRGETTRAPITLSHFIAFAPPADPPPHCIPPKGEPFQPKPEWMPPFELKPEYVVSERYDSMVVQSPTDVFRAAVRAHQQTTAHPTRGVTAWKAITAGRTLAQLRSMGNDDAEVERLTHIRDELRAELRRVQAIVVREAGEDARLK